MINLYSPDSEIELALIKSLLEAEEIPYYVHNDHFGSMYVGLQIKYFNRKMVMVAPEFENAAIEILSDFFDNQGAPSEKATEADQKTSLWDKVRMTIEALLFCWIVPGKRWAKKDIPNNDSTKTESATEEKDATN